MLSLGVLLLASFMLFFNLGAYALWDDEATTALFAQSVWRTGDTSALIGKNIVAYNSGIELKDLHNRFIPPLPFYLAAPFVGQIPGSAWAARFPFALCGLLTLVVVLVWLRRSYAALATWLLISAGFLTNVSFFLFSRQCRYYAPVILLSVLAAYFYHFRSDRVKTTLGLTVSSLLLLSSNYLCYAGVMGSIIVDYLFWGRQEKATKTGQILLFFGSQVLFGAILISIYNPFGIDLWGVPRQPWLIEKIKLFLWNWRDLNSCEFGAGILIVLALVMAFVFKERRLLQCFQAILVYMVIITVLSPQPINLLSVAFVRYLIPLIPLCILTMVLCIQVIKTKSKTLAMIIAFLAFFTNILHGGSLAGTDKKTVFSHVISEGKIRSTFFEYISELLNPPPSAYRNTARWVNQNISSHNTVWVAPGYAAYPLMYHAPQPLYAWQLDKDNEQFKDLPRIHFKEEEIPDYIIVFGIYVHQVRQMIANYSANGIHFQLVGQVPNYWYDLTRPELFWHAFTPVSGYSKDDEEVYVFKRTDVK